MTAYLTAEKIVPGEVVAHYVMENAEENTADTVRVFPTNEERATFVASEKK